MKKLTLIAVMLASAGAFSSSASAQDSNFQTEFVKRTVLGQWTPDASAVSNDTPNVDASLGEFAASIWGKYPRLTEEQRGHGEATADQFTQQFK